MGTFGGAGPLDPAGTDFAIGYVRGTLEVPQDHAPSGSPRTSPGCPAKLDHVDALAADGVIGGEEPNAADLQIGATLRVLLTVGDLHP